MAYKTIENTADSLRSIMRETPSPVTIVTSRNQQEMRGATIGSFTSLSMDPPLISFNLKLNSQMHQVMTGGIHFAVHIPSRQQSELCSRFARSNTEPEDLFSDIGYTMNDHGIPILDNTRGVIHCVKHANFLAGDHDIIIGMVTDVTQTLKEDPLLYYNRSFHELGRKTA